LKGIETHLRGFVTKQH